MPSNDRHEIAFRSPTASPPRSGFTAVIAVDRPLATSITCTSPIDRASTCLYARRRPSPLSASENATVGPVPIRSARPSRTDTRTIGCSNMCAPRANVPSFACTYSALLSGVHTYSFTHASSIANTRGEPPAAGTIVRLRGAMMSRLPPVEMNAIDRPSGEKRGPVFMPARSTIVRVAPLSTATA
jgi:hypothetical protein